MHNNNNENHFIGGIVPLAGCFFQKPGAAERDATNHLVVKSAS